MVKIIRTSMAVGFDILQCILMAAVSSLKHNLVQTMTKLALIHCDVLELLYSHTRTKDK